VHLGGHCYNRVELLTSKGAEKSTVASAADCEVEADSLMAGHERKHNACRAEYLQGCMVEPLLYTLCNRWHYSLAMKAHVTKAPLVSNVFTFGEHTLFQFPCNIVTLIFKNLQR